MSRHVCPIKNLKEIFYSSRPAKNIFNIFFFLINKKH